MASKKKTSPRKKKTTRRTETAPSDENATETAAVTDDAAVAVADPPADTAPDASATTDADPGADAAEQPPAKKKTRRRKKTTKKVTAASAADEADGAGAADDAGTGADADDDAGADAPKSSRGRKTSGTRKKTTKKTSTRKAKSPRGTSSSAPVEREVDEVMIVNDVPGEECRIAVLEEGHLEELYAERTATATNVGNIYKGRVVNVEPAIQAAFVDYGEGANGFLHISDLHPRYFPGEERTERVGKKIPRRERPAIQDALKRGDEVLVQVLKEGIGSKGPTLTSYLSIPGRMLVLMPEMDRVGVSRKVEDDDTRKAARKILDQLELPEGFGFILRTAGLERSKTDLKRDVAYLMRLWKVMERRMQKVGAPCELYRESDLLIRTVRDVIRPSIKAIVVDSESAYERVNTFLSVIAPRSAPKVVRYTRQTPIFHAFDIERQIELIHSREVPLPSGGALVIEQTEALVAIDVNSGRSRSARDSETNAYQTNCEAVDEICRQLRLRDLGGLIVNDLIDMRHHSHRRSIEERIKNHLKRDRARASISRISEFGLVEMTRQRMRPSMRKSHYIDCPHCQARGEVKSPDSVAADVTRNISYFLDQDRIRRVEIVCSPRVASVLLSRKRRQLVHLEDRTGKIIDVRVSDDIALDRVDYYAYDERSSDLDLSGLRSPKVPSLEQLEKEYERYEAEGGDDHEDGDGEESGGRRRRRRRRKPAPADATAIALAGDFVNDIDEDEDDEFDFSDDADESGDGAKKKRKRRRRRRRRGGEGDVEGDAPRDGETHSESSPAPPEPELPDKPMRLHLLGKELDVTSKDLLQRCRDEGMEVKNHMSSVTPEQIVLIRSWYQPEPEVAPDADDRAATSDHDDEDDDRPKKRRRRRRGGRRRNKHRDGDDERGADDHESRGDGGSSSSGGDRPKERAPRDAEPSAPSEPEKPAPQVETTPPKPKRRGLYRNRKTLSPSAREALAEASDS